MRYAILLVAIFVSAHAKASWINDGAQPVGTTYSLRELVRVLPTVLRGANGDQCEIRVIPKANSLVIALKSSNSTWGRFSDSFELTGATAEGAIADFPSASSWLDSEKVRRLNKIDSELRFGKIEKSVNFRMGQNGFSVSVVKTVDSDPLNLMGYIRKCFFTYNK